MPGWEVRSEATIDTRSATGSHGRAIGTDGGDATSRRSDHRGPRTGLLAGGDLLGGEFRMRGGARCRSRRTLALLVVSAVGSEIVRVSRCLRVGGPSSSELVST